MTKPLSPRLYLEALNGADPSFIGQRLLQLIQWQLRYGQGTIFYSGGWYLRAIHRSWQREQARRDEAAERTKEKLAKRGMTSTMSEAVASAMEALG